MDDVTYSLLIEVLTRHDSRFAVRVKHEVVNKNKGEKKELRHRMLVHPDIGGKRRHIPVRYDGDEELIGVRSLKAIVRRFDLPTGIFSDAVGSDSDSQS